MRVLVCGSREWTDIDAIDVRLRELPGHPLIIHGGARGADMAAGVAATDLGFHTAEIRALWKFHGQRAGVIRNGVMLDLEPDLVLAFQVNGSRGTQHTIDEARRRGIPVEVIEPVSREADNER